MLDACENNIQKCFLLGKDGFQKCVYTTKIHREKCVCYEIFSLKCCQIFMRTPPLLSKSHPLDKFQSHPWKEALWAASYTSQDSY